MTPSPMASRTALSTSAQRPTGVRHNVVAFAVALAVITYIDRVCISQAAPAIRRDLGIGPVEMGTVFTAFGWAYALCEIPGGYLGDRYGPRTWTIQVSNPSGSVSNSATVQVKWGRPVRLRAWPQAAVLSAPRPSSSRSTTPLC